MAGELDGVETALRMPGAEPIPPGLVAEADALLLRAARFADAELARGG